MGRGSPPKILIVKIKICPKIQRVRLNNFRASGRNLTGLFQSTSREAGVIKWAQFLQCPPPKICDGKKSPKFFRDFWQLSTLIANISGKDQHIKNRKSSCQKSRKNLGEKNLAYFGLQTKKILTLIHVHPNGLFLRETVSRPLGGAAPWNFYTR